tara:strand:- start:874 stop:2163 length:1290 start_codon:yes stop_codon:yes gene_type:complete
MSLDKNFIYLLFTPFMWYKIVSLIFYGFGPSAYYFGNDFTVAFMNNYYFTSNETLHKIICIYLIIILSIDLLVMIFNSIFDLNFKKQVTNIDMKLFLYYVLACGIFFKYFIAIPLTIAGIGYPGVVNQLTRFILIGLFISYTLGFEHKFYKRMFYSIFIIELLSSFLVLSKEPLLITAIFATFIILYYNLNLKRLIINAILLIFVYSFIQPVFSILRSSESNTFGITSVAELSKAYSTVQFYYSDDFSTSIARSYQGWWTRISYVNYQAFAVESYNKGYIGDTFKKNKYILTPRFLYPEKPNMNSGSQYHTLIKNRYSGKVVNNTGPGIFFEAYWNGGFLYLFMVIFYFTILIFFISKIIVQNLIQKNFIILFLSVNAIYLGRGIDDWFSARYGTFVLYVILIYFINALVYRSLQYIVLNKDHKRLEKI